MLAVRLRVESMNVILCYYQMKLVYKYKNNQLYKYLIKKKKLKITSFYLILIDFLIDSKCHSILNNFKISSGNQYIQP